MTKNHMNEVFPITSICREDLIHPVIGLTMHEASMVTDEQMRKIASKLSSNPSNQILKSSIKIVAEDVISKK